MNEWLNVGMKGVGGGVGCGGGGSARAARGRAQRKAPGRAGVQGAEPLGKHGELEEAHRIYGTGKKMVKVGSCHLIALK